VSAALRIVGIPGSLRRASLNRALLGAAAEHDPSRHRAGDLAVGGIAAA